jgi:beta-lactamase regulating signal transducer with metallopeptidase domain
MFALRMTSLVDVLADVYLLSTALLLAGLGVMSWLKQPARRLAVARSIVAALAALTVLATAPGWPRPAAIEWSTRDTARTRDTPTPVAAITTGASEPARQHIEGTRREPSVAAVSIAQSTQSEIPATSRAFEPIALPPWRSIVAAAFTIGAAMNLAWLTLGAILAMRMRRSARAASPRLQSLITPVLNDMHKTPRVGISSRIGLPVAVGMIRPMIVLPEGFVASEPDDRLQAAVSHEWAHIRNGDLRWLALTRLLNIALFAQPLFWWLRREIRADQEALADAAASAICGDGRVAYAETLVGWARSAHRAHTGALAAAALALWERPSMLRRRVRLLLERDYRVEPATTRDWKIATACVGLLAAFMLSLVTVRPNSVVSTAAPKDAVSGDRFQYAGRVLDPDGKPFAGAKLHLAYFGYQGQGPPPIRATSDSEGRFQIEVHRKDFVDSTDETPWKSAQVVATAAGFGLGWADASPDEHSHVDPRNLTIRLVPGDAPISGRLVDLQGHPVVGALVRHQEILEPEQGDLSSWLEASTTGSGGSWEIERKYLKRKLWPRGSGLPIVITTDAQGQFSIAGVGRERLIRLNISGPTIQTKEISVVTRDVAAFHVNHGRGSPDWGIALYYGTRFTHASAPTQPVSGIITDKDTGKPLAGVRIASDKTAEFPVYGFNGIEATSDEHGRYRLIGLPKGRGNHVIAIPAKGQPYLAAGIEIPVAPSLDVVSLDIGLKRGIVIEGRVTDKATGEPLKSYVAYNAYQDNPYLSEAPGFRDARVWGRYETAPDGSFRVVGLPGRGLIAAMYIGGGKQYLTGMGLTKVVSTLDTLPVVPDGMLGHFNTFSDVDLPKEATTFHHDLALMSGVTRTVRVVDPQGRSLAGARIKFQPRVTNLSEPQQSAEFQVKALGPDETRPLVAFHDGLKLAGSVDVQAKQEGVTELKLLPWGSLVGRLVDEDGAARAKVDIVYSERHDYPVATDSQGRFRVDALVPGKPAKIWVSPTAGYLSGTVAKALVLKPGEVKDLGDVREAQ